MIINVLGTNYSILESTPQEHPGLNHCDGYFDSSTQQIVIDVCSTPGEMAKENLEEYKMKVKRHELVHAFLHESGLSDNSPWATNEEMVDWIAIQFPKMLKAFQSVKCI